MRSFGLGAVVFMLAAGGCDGGAGTATSDGPPADADQAAICAACGADEICVQTLHSNGQDLCQSTVRCEPRDPHCTGTACTPDCNFWQCGDGVDAGVLSCGAMPETCPNAIAGALQCWGP